MNLTYLLAMLFLLLFALLSERSLLRRTSTGCRLVHYAAVVLTLGLLAARQWHWNVPMPSRYFIHTICPWVSKLVGL